MPTQLEQFEEQIRQNVIDLHGTTCTFVQKFVEIARLNETDPQPSAKEIRQQLLKAVMAELAQPCDGYVFGLRYIPDWMRKVELPFGPEYRD